MAKMGFSPQTTPFRPTSFSPPYFWFCRSCTHFYSTSSSPNRVLCRLEDRAGNSANNLNADLPKLNQRKKYSTFPNYDRETYNNMTRGNLAYSQLRYPLVRRQVEEEDTMEVWVGKFSPLNTVENWGIATEECKIKKRLYAHGETNVSVNLKTLPEEEIAERVEHGSGLLGLTKVVHPYGLDNMGYRDSVMVKDDVFAEKDYVSAETKIISSDSISLCEKIAASGGSEIQTRLSQVYDRVLVVNSVEAARDVVKMLINEYKNFVHACDTEVANIDVKEETPVDHGEIICFSIYSGLQADYGDGKSCVWVDVLDGGGKDLIKEFAPFFEDPSIKKVWHNYSFDNHIVENYGLKLSGFYADTMHMARLWNSSRRMQGGYSLEALTGDPAVMSDSKCAKTQTPISIYENFIKIVIHHHHHTISSKSFDHTDLRQIPAIHVCCPAIFLHRSRIPAKFSAHPTGYAVQSDRTTSSR